MKTALEILFREIAFFILQKNYRKFIYLLIKLAFTNPDKPGRTQIYKFKFIYNNLKAFAFQFRGIFVENDYKFSTDNKTPVIIDCGANIGLSILYFKNLFPDSVIHAFEPFEDAAKYAFRNISENNIGDVTLHQKAVWINNKGVQFNICGSDGSSIYGDNNDTFVSSVRLKDFIDSFDGTIDFLKMDIEGPEAEIIPDCGSSLQNIKNIFIEYHSYKNKSQSLGIILNTLSENGFRYFIRPEYDRIMPFINKNYKSNNLIDLQLKIYAYK